MYDTIDNAFAPSMLMATGSSLSDSQEKILILLQIGSAILSVSGSGVIVCKILRSMKRSSSPYDRIILGLSSCDFVSSFTYAVGPFLLPSDTSQRVWAFGNDTTCTWLGFFAQLACLWAIWYNCVLSFYYLLTVRFKVKRREFTRKYELWMHLPGAIFFPLTAFIGLVGNWYSEERFAMLCWIGEVPKGCYDTGDCWGALVAFIFGASTTVITIFSVVINNIVIYVFVRKNLRSSPPSTAGSFEFECKSGSDSESESEGEMSDIEGSTTQGHSIRHQLRHEAAIQGFLYVSTFLLVFTPAFVMQVLEGMTNFGDENLSQMYPLLVLNSLLLPLQGFFNVFIYVRPSYKRFRAAQPEKSTLFVLQHALFDPNIPRLSASI